MEMSLPEGQVRDLLFDVAIESGDSSMRNLFYLDRQDRMMDAGFYRYLYQRNPGLLREVNGGVEARPDGLFWLVGGTMISCPPNLTCMRRWVRRLMAGYIASWIIYIFGSIIISG